MQVRPEVEIHLLESLENTLLDQDIEVYTKPEKPKGKRILENCESRESCVRYLLDDNGLGLKEKKVSEETVSRILANYCCATCNGCNS